MDNLQFQDRLLQWYGENKRVLPWRSTRSPYRIWISEIMLQQTRVAVVVDRYRDFLLRFPTISSLAAARTSDVLAAWSGLGYYRRARAAHQTAKRIVNEHAARFPRKREQLQQLPGIGEYTSAAIASIAFAAPHAVVDGNVRRVLNRLSGRALSPSEHARFAQKLLSLSRPGDFNQAMMELGATVCTPRPNCATCPVAESCASMGREPRRKTSKRARKVVVRLALARRKDRVFLVRRPDSVSVMPGMWELPSCIGRSGAGTLTFRHSIMETSYVARVSLCHEAPTGAAGRWFSGEEAAALPLTGLARKILSHVGVL